MLFTVNSFLHKEDENQNIVCAPSEVRTHDLEIMRLARCLLRYRGIRKQLELYFLRLSKSYQNHRTENPGRNFGPVRKTAFAIKKFNIKTLPIKNLPATYMQLFKSASFADGRIRTYAPVGKLISSQSP